MPSEERLMILQMVADKKISATEAAELLKALDAREPAAPQPNPQPGPRPQATGSLGGPGAVPPIPPIPPMPPRPSAPPAPPLGGLGSFIENIVERVTNSVSDAFEPRWEFPSELTGDFTAEVVPLRLVTPNGRIELKAWDEPGYKAEILVKTGGANQEEARQRANDAYTVVANETQFDFEAKRWNWNWDNQVVHVTLYVPRNKKYQLEARTGNGNILMDEAFLVDAKVTSGNGKINFSGGADRMAIRTGNGSVDILGDVADLEAGSGNGSITVTPNGDRHQYMRLNTGNGSLTVVTNRLASTTGYKVDASTGMGSVTLDMPAMQFERNSQNFANKHVIGQTAGYESAAVQVSIHARTGLGTISIQ